MRGYCDLHTHSYFSDGTLSPTELIEEAERIGLDAIALTDHNTMQGLTEFLSAAKGKHVRAIPGIEFSTEYRGVELHILALGVKKEHYTVITSITGEFDRLKKISNEQLVQALNNAGYKVSLSEIELAAKGKVNRAHIASALMENGYLSSVKEGFDTLLSPKNGFYTPPPRFGSLDAIDFIEKIGAVSVLAHPFISADEAFLREFLPIAKTHGLCAMETMYTKYDEKTTALAKRTAAEFHLNESGGSDFHGTRKPETALGTGTGELFVPIETLDTLLDSKLL